MKRFASHFLFLPAYGYLKQYAVETEEGVVVRFISINRGDGKCRMVAGGYRAAYARRVERT